MSQVAQKQTAAPVKAILVVQRGDGWQTTYSLEPGRSVMIGRSSNCGLQLAGDQLAPIHCMMRLHECKLLLQDWFSSTGTTINGQPAIGEVVVPEGALIQVGDYVVRAELHYESSSTRTSPIGQQHQVKEAPKPAEPEPLPKRDLQEENNHLQRRIDTLAEENNMLRQQLKDLLAQMAERSSDEADPFAQDTIELLRAEVEHLQSELLHSQGPASEPAEFTSTEIPEPSDQLVERVDELLDELKQSDHRIAALEELLRASEEATEAEREERRQLESWVGDIERRIGDRESDWKAEIDSLQGRLSDAAQQQRRLEQRLAATSSATNDDERTREQIENWKSRTVELQQQLQDREAECQSLQQKFRDAAQQTADRSEFKQLEASIREERVRIAQERAELARSRAEVATLRAQLEQHAAVGGSSNRESDNKMRAFREHLREIHDREQSEQQVKVGLTARLAKLWKHLDG